MKGGKSCLISVVRVRLWQRSSDCCAEISGKAAMQHISSQGANFSKQAELMRTLNTHTHTHRNADIHTHRHTQLRLSIWRP